VASLSIALGAVLSGCFTSVPVKAPPEGAARSSSINGLSLLTMPMAISIHSHSGVDGVAVKIFASSPGQTKSQPIQAGTLDILMFDGIVKEPQTTNGSARHVWSFAASQLAAYKISTAVGAAYTFALSWDNDAPAGDKITLFAHYRPPQGPPVFSAPGYLLIVR
jgi:hypothetical protein